MFNKMKNHLKNNIHSFAMGLSYVYGVDYDYLPFIR